MQLIIKLKPERGLSLPIAYHHLLQSALYSLMTEEGVSESYYHKKQTDGNNRDYGSFTFGKIHGPYRLDGRQIIFSKELVIEVRSVDFHCLELVKKRILEKGITLAGRHIEDVEVTTVHRTVETEEILIAMDSPVCVYQTDAMTKKTRYWTPDDAEFCTYINQNFQRKYRAFYGEEPESDIEIWPVDINNKDKYVTRYKGFYVTAWGGRYCLKGKRKYLDFLYQTGLGCKNSQGFGMFEIITS